MPALVNVPRAQATFSVRSEMTTVREHRCARERQPHHRDVANAKARAVGKSSGRGNRANIENFFGRRSK